MLIEFTAASGKIASERMLSMNVTRRKESKTINTVWLAAMLEAEGTFTFQYNEQEKNGKIHSHIQPLVIFTNSDMKLVDKVDVILRSLGFDPYRRPPFKGGIGKKDKAEVQYSGFRSLPLLKLLRPYIVGEKIECVDCMISFIEYRQKLQAEGKPKQKYSEVEFDLLRRVREINSGHWRQTPKFSKISTVAVGERREECARKLALVG